MNNSAQKSPHLFHIPVMGTGFSVDTPLKVAKYGISSVVSLVDDILLEQMRKFHSDKLGLEYIEITERAEDARANRVQAYMEFLVKQIGEQVKALQSSPFEPGSEITRYFEMLPESPLKESYTKMLAISDPAEMTKLQDVLRRQAVPGTIDVNLMTKLDRDTYKRGQKLPPEYADALSALRGYAKSSVRSSIIFSAGFNRRLYAYLANFDDFFQDDKGVLRKKIVLKVSDFLSNKEILSPRCNLIYETLRCDQIVTFLDGCGCLLWIPFWLLVLLLLCLLCILAFFLLVALILILFTTFVTHGVVPFRLKFPVLRILCRNKLEVGGIEPPSEHNARSSSTCVVCLYLFIKTAAGKQATIMTSLLV